MPLPSIERVPGGRAFASLSRRVRTLIVAGVLFLVLFLLALFLPVPYVILTPGPTYNTLGTDPFSKDPVIVLGGKGSSRTSGHLNMTTVQIRDQSVTALGALVAWLKGDQIVLPRTAITPPGVSNHQQEQRDAQDFSSSQDSATVAALCELGYPKGFGVLSVLADGPSHGVLRTGDQFVTLAGRPAGTSDKLAAVVQSLTPGTTVPVAVKRQGQPATVKVKLGPPPKGGEGGRPRGGGGHTRPAPLPRALPLEN